MKITIHRGLNQIGGCITEIQSLSGTKILIDFGHNLPNGNDVAEDVYECPKNIDDLLKGCSAVFYTHYHGDHLGFAAEVHKRGVPQYMGSLAIKMMLHLNQHMTYAEDLKVRAEANLEALKEFCCFNILDKVLVGDISITPFSVSHSAPDSYMFLIECDGRKVFHTGDFRDHGYLGKGLYPMLEKYIIPAGVDILITEGTNVGQTSKSVIPEDKICQELQEIIQKYKNVFILGSSADMDRLWSVHEAHRQSFTGRPLVCDGYQKEMIEIFADAYCNSLRYYRFDLKEIYDYRLDNRKLLEWIREKGVTMLIRNSDKFQDILNLVLPDCRPEETCLVYSMFRGYIDPKNKAFNPVLHKFVEQFPNRKYCHTSGHASKECIEKICTLVNPKVAIIPIHTESSFTYLNLQDNIQTKIFEGDTITLE